MDYRNTASYGKRQEYIAVAKLLEKGFDVYMTLVDDQGIDCVIRIDDKKGSLRYLDIQIKARSKDAKQGHTFAAMTFEPRENLFFIFFTECNGLYWVIPSVELAKLCHQNKTGANEGKRHLTLPKLSVGTKSDKFDIYKNGFNLLWENIH